MLEMIWGLKTVAFFDFWSIEHLLAGMSIGSWVAVKNKHFFKKLYAHLEGLITQDKIAIVRIKFEAAVVVALSYFWEAIEFYGETGYWGEWAEYWFYGVEFWPNRVIFDPLIVLGGFFISLRYPKLIWPARIISLAWLLIHLFVFPHSMYLNELFI